MKIKILVSACLVGAVGTFLFAMLVKSSGRELLREALRADAADAALMQDHRAANRDVVTRGEVLRFQAEEMASSARILNFCGFGLLVTAALYMLAGCLEEASPEEGDGEERGDEEVEDALPNPPRHQGRPNGAVRKSSPAWRREEGA